MFRPSLHSRNEHFASRLLLQFNFDFSLISVGELSMCVRVCKGECKCAKRTMNNKVVYIVIEIRKVRGYR